MLGMKWKGAYYVDMALPFGLRSAPFIFTSVVDMSVASDVCLTNWPPVCSFVPTWAYPYTLTNWKGRRLA